MWSDTKGSEAGIHVRYLDGDGRIDPLHGQSVRVNSRPGESWPAIDHGPNGFIVAWQGDRDKDKDHDRDLFVRLLSNELGIAGHPETRLTDYNVPPKAKPNQGLRVRIPSVAIAPGTVFIAYRLEDEKKRVIVRQRIPLEDLEKPNAGLLESKDPNRSNRVAGDVENISDEKLPGEAPAIACGKVGCFAVWHGEPTRVGGESGGAWVALLDPTEGKAQWKKKISDKGGHPSLAVNDGQVAVAYYEAGRIKMAYLSSDGVGASSTLLRVHDVDRPRPTLTAGVDKNEWSVAWQDSDVPRGTSEVYASRVVCGAR
jgi:serine/threonine-protein kinase